MLLPSAYLPPIDWFAQLCSGATCSINIGEWYRKQTIRNRCRIDSPNGVLSMTVPIDRSTFTAGKCRMKDVRISSHEDWRRQHWYALETSYFNSPFFEYLQDDFRPIYDKEWAWLVEFETELTSKCCELLGLPMPALTDTDAPADWQPAPPASPSQPYYQVFAHKHGFQPNLSIIDLIFNMGNEAILTLGDKR